MTDRRRSTGWPPTSGEGPILDCADRPMAECQDRGEITHPERSRFKPLCQRAPGWAGFQPQVEALGLGLPAQPS